MIFGKPKQVTVQVQANVAWSVARDPQSGLWVGVCEPLGLNAIGETWIEFQQCAAEALGLLLVDLFEAGELDQFLRERGWSAQTPLPPRGKRVRFDVPFKVVERSDVRELARV